MVDSVSLNATSSTFNYAVSSISPATWMPMLAIAIFIVIAITLFMLWKNFRRFIYGLVVIIPSAILWWISSSIASSAGSGNWSGVKFVGFSIAGIIASILLGAFLEKKGTFKRWEQEIENTTTNTKDDGDKCNI